MNHLVITGASSGIGLQTAHAFMQAGYAVTNLSRRHCPVAAVNHINCDLSVHGFVDSISSQLISTIKDADELVLIHNACQLHSDSAIETSSNVLREVLEVNLIAANSLNYLIIPYMKAGSSVLYVGSTLGEKAVANSYSYVVSKHAQIGMMRATCQDLAGRNIHTTCICPGFTDTEMLREHIPAEILPEIATQSAFNRLVEPREIADTLLWAATSPVINGAVIHANLGQIES